MPEHALAYVFIGAGPAGRRRQGVQAHRPRAAQAGRERGQGQRQQAPRVHQQRAVRCAHLHLSWLRVNWLTRMIVCCYASSGAR